MAIDPIYLRPIEEFESHPHVGKWREGQERIRHFTPEERKANSIRIMEKFDALSPFERALVREGGHRALGEFRRNGITL